MGLIDFFNSAKTFIIPVYQRKYDWQQEHCQQLFYDVECIIKTGREHFLGTFVYQTKAAADGLNSYVIIDGQQRMTSIILSAKALYEFDDDEARKEEILEFFIKNLTGRLRNQCKLKPTEYDLPVFEKLMKHEKFLENDFSVEEQNTVIYRNYLYFRQKIFDSNYSAEQFYNAIKKLNIVGILLGDENPQEIFESLNSTGKDLTESDLIRNYLLMSLDYETQENLYKKYWLEIEKLLHTSENIENFMVQYLITKRRSNSIAKNGKNVHLTKNILYYSFKRYFEENYLSDDLVKNVENFLKDMYYYAKIYNKFLFSSNDNFAQLSELEQKFYELTFLLETTNAPIILMFLYDKYEQAAFDEETFIEFTKAMISLSFRSKICKGGGISAQFAGNVVAKLSQSNNIDMDSFVQAITFGKGKYAFPGDEKFQQSLREDDLYLILRSDGTKYLLYALERNSEHSAELPPYSKASVEHIMPQKLSAGWKNYLMSKGEYGLSALVHTLGNLTLMAQEYNSKLRNEDFEVKKNEYAKSNFFYTRELKNYSDWTSNQIQVRAKKLASAALKIWALPEGYNITTTTTNTTFYLDDDLGIFTGTKPATISISNVEKNIKDWRELLETIFKTLYEKDAAVFKQAVQKENRMKLFTNESAEMRSPLKIAENCYIESNSSTESKLYALKKVVENFDSISSTNFKDDIWFTLRQ